MAAETQADRAMPREAIILVGGRGTRLASVVSDVPKPLAPVGGRPFLEWVVDLLRQAGLTHVVFASGHLGDHIESHFRDGADWGLRVSHVREPQPLGTGGAVRHALAATTTSPLLVLNGDSLCRLDLPRLAHVHAAHRAAATLWLLPQPDCRRFASVEIDADGAVLGFREKAANPHAGLISAGLYLLERRTIATIPDGIPVSIEREVFPGLVGRGLYAAVGDDAFIDIGTPESYAGALNALDRIIEHG